MKLTIFNRDDDSQPMLIIEAESPVEKKQLTRLHKEMHPVQLKAIRLGKAGIGNPCGMGGNLKGVNDLYISVVLGGGFPHSNRVQLALKKLDEVVKVLS